MPGQNSLVYSYLLWPFELYKQKYTIVKRVAIENVSADDVELKMRPNENLKIFSGSRSLRRNQCLSIYPKIELSVYRQF